MILRDYQKQLSYDVRLLLKDHKRVVMQSDTGCHEINHPILMFNGTIKSVQDIIINDEVCGIDGSKRTVINLHRGKQKMYRISPTKGESFAVNRDHILHLWNTKDKTSLDITVESYIKQNSRFKHIHKLKRAKLVDFHQNESLEINPYILGLLIGDGSLKNGNVGLTTADDIIDKEFKGYLISIDSFYSTSKDERSSCWTIRAINFDRGSGEEKLRGLINKLKLNVNSGDKFIPLKYKTSSVNNRLKLLAGLIDTDGHYCNNGFDYVSKSERLLDDVIFVSRSLGFSAYKSVKKINGIDYYRTTISGDTHLIPTKLPRKKATIRLQKKCVQYTGFKISLESEGSDYYGFELKENPLFLDGYFNITHNSGKTAIATHLVDRASIKDLTTVFLCDRQELIEQTVKHFHKVGISCQLITKDTKQIVKSKVYVGMIESFYRRYVKKWFDSVKIDLFILDEAHIGNYYKLLDMVPQETRVIALTATPVASSKNHQMSKYYDNIACGPTTDWLIEGGFLVPSLDIGSEKILNLSQIGGEFSSESQMKEFQENDLDEKMFALWKQHASDRQTIVYNINIAHNNKVYEMFHRYGYDVGKISSDDDVDDRKEVIQQYQSGRFQILCNVGILTKGYDSPETSCIVANFSTASLSKWRQVVGRGGRPFPDKRNFITIDMGNNIPLHGSFNDVIDWAGVFWNDSRDKNFKIKKKIKLCPLCYAYITNIHIEACPVCQSKISIRNLIDMEEMMPPEIADKKPEDMTLKELYAYAKFKQYKKGWAWNMNLANIARRQQEQRMKRIQQQQLI